MSSVNVKTLKLIYSLFTHAFIYCSFVVHPLQKNTQRNYSSSLQNFKLTLILVFSIYVPPVSKKVYNQPYQGL